MQIENRIPLSNLAEPSLFFSLVESFQTISTESKLSAMLHGDIQQRFGFESFVCGIGSAPSGRIYHLINGGFSDAYLKYYISDDKHISSPVFKRWRKQHGVQHINVEKTATVFGDLALWSQNARDAGIKSMVTHGFSEPMGNCSYFAFVNPVEWNEQQSRFLDLLMPNMHAALNRVYAGLCNSTRDRLITKREGEVLQMIAGGKSNSQIADRLGLSPWTIKIHITHIMRKLNASSRSHAAALGIRMGLIDI